MAYDLAKFVILIATGLLCVKSNPLNDDVCYSDRSDPYIFFATKTSYFAVGNFDAAEIKFEGCTPKSFWLLARHGTRNPGKKDMVKILTNSSNLRSRILANHLAGIGSLCASDLDGLASWNFNLTLDAETMLTDSGRLEHFQLGERFKKRLPDLLGGSYQKGSFTFRHTHKARTEDSARAFSNGLFPGQEPEIFDPAENNSHEKDRLLRFYDFCKKWTSEVDENEATYEEQRLFVQTKHVQNLVKRVGTKLGFDVTTDDVTFKLNDVILIYDICRFEKAWHPDKVSVWCSAFEDQDLRVLEYYEELKYWYNSGYYYSINSMVACPLIKDLVDKFGGEDSSFDENKFSMENGTFYFSHSEAVLPFLRLLDLYRDAESLRHDNFDSMQNRKYRTSKIGPFSSNIGFVLFDCAERKKVLAMHQEQPIQLDQCSDLLCDWEDFIGKYKDRLECDVDQICSIGGEGKVEDGIKTMLEEDADSVETSSGSKSSTSSTSSSSSSFLTPLMTFCLFYAFVCFSS